MVSKEQIIADFNELCEIMKNVRTVEDGRRLAKDLNTLIEIGTFGDCGYDCMESHFDDVEPKDIEWFRVEWFKSLSYVYFYTDGVILFDVEDEDEDECIYDSVSIEKILRG